jgi:uncharacterized protein (TIGR02246 family)
MAERDMKGVAALIDSYLSAYKSRDINALSSIVAQDANFTAFGTDANETWYGWESFRTMAEKLFRAVKEIEWKRGKQTINFSQDGNVAWFAEELAGKFLSAGERREFTFRLTGVAERRGGKWVLVQFHRSVPVEKFAVPYLETHGVRFD